MQSFPELAYAIGAFTYKVDYTYKRTYFKSMAKVIILSGSNSGNREFFLAEALKEIEIRIGSLFLSSSIYETEPWGFEAEQDFLNQVWIIDTQLSPDEVLQMLLEIEQKLGRIRVGTTYTSRVIDLDILYYDDFVIHHPGLTIPHPRIQERNFVLQPLEEILPEMVHPVLLKNHRQLLAECKDECQARKLG